MTASAGAALGLAIGAAAVLASWWLEDRRPASTVDRLAPYVGRAGIGRAVLDRTIDLRGLTSRSSGRDPALVLLLRRAGRPADVARHRLERLAWSAAGATLALVVALALDAEAAATAALGLAGGAAGWWASDQRLRHRARQRQRAIERQLPMVADLLALALSAGMPPLAALEASADAIPGPLAQEIHAAAASVRSGTPAPVALRAMAADVGLGSLGRLVDGLLVAMDHGTAVADVARAQAADLRSDERRRLMESAGRRDVAMLVPIVFLVLPSVVVIALFPGLQALRLVVP